MIPSSYNKLAVGLYFMILHLISYFHKSTALFWGLNGHFLYYTYRKKKNIFKTSFPPEFQLILLHVSVFSYFT